MRYTWLTILIYLFCLYPASWRLYLSPPHYSFMPVEYPLESFVCENHKFLIPNSFPFCTVCKVRHWLGKTQKLGCSCRNLCGLAVWKNKNFELTYKVVTFVSKIMESWFKNHKRFIFPMICSLIILDDYFAN